MPKVLTDPTYIKVAQHQNKKVDCRTVLRHKLCHKLPIAVSKTAQSCTDRTRESHVISTNNSIYPNDI